MLGDRPLATGLQPLPHPHCIELSDPRRVCGWLCSSSFGYASASRTQPSYLTPILSLRLVQRWGGVVTMMAAERHEPFKTMVEGRIEDISNPRPMMNHLTPPHPDCMYGVAKIAGEAMARLFTVHHGSAIVARIGRVREEDQPANVREASVHFSHRDVAQFFEKCVKAPDEIKWDVFYGVSDNFTRFRDIDHARKMIGYRPKDGIKHWPTTYDICRVTWVSEPTN